MPGYVALLRGVNVGGRNKVAMPDLRRVVAALGYGDVSTYIQSGNVIFTGPDGDPRAIARRMETAIADELGVRPGVVVVSAQNLARIVAANPYHGEPDHKRVHVIFRDRDPDPELLDAVRAAQEKAAAKGSRDEVSVVGRATYLHTPDGFGRSELAALLARIDSSPKASAPGTARNWGTVTKLLALCEAAAAAGR